MKPSYISYNDRLLDESNKLNLDIEWEEKRIVTSWFIDSVIANSSTSDRISQKYTLIIIITWTLDFKRVFVFH